MNYPDGCPFLGGKGNSACKLPPQLSKRVEMANNEGLLTHYHMLWCSNEKLIKIKINTTRILRDEDILHSFCMRTKMIGLEVDKNMMDAAMHARKKCGVGSTNLCGT